MGLKSTTEGGEIVQVQGGHIIRATGRKDRHSKVFTAKGPRDRRVRLSAHTAIQFYDVQDRLGYDRPSKAVDWLIKKAKASIDKLDELPPWDPIANNCSNVVHVNGGGCGDEFHVGDHSGSSSFYVSQGHQGVDSESLMDGGGGDSMKSFFPMNNNSGNDNGCGEHSISFQNYHHELMVSRGVSQGQDLCLSLHTIQDPSGGGSGGHHQTNRSHHDSGLFQGSGSSSLGIEGGNGGWVDTQNPHDLGRFTRMLGWPFSAGASTGNGGGGSGSGGGDNRGGNFINLPPFSPQRLLLGQQQSPITTATYSQRDSLPSSFSPLVRGLQDQQHHHHEDMSNIGQGSDGFMGYYIPSQFHGHEIMHGGATNSMSINRASSSSLSPDSSQH